MVLSNFSHCLVIQFNGHLLLNANPKVVNVKFIFSEFLDICDNILRIFVTVMNTFP